MACKRPKEKMMNKVKLMVLGVGLAVVLAACGGATGSSYSAPPPTGVPAPTTAPASASGEQPTVMVASNATLGKILVDGKGITLYIYTKDTVSTSNCSGGCATAWPPLTVAAGVTPTAGPGVAGTLGVIQRADGSYQVTIDGKPLYYYVRDARPGDTTGQGVSNVWYVVQEAASY
jgi:predicted lipoprotein with Yx(FWY)xxD motif